MRDVENIREVRPADYVSADFFRIAKDPRSGLDGYYSLAMAHHLLESGISAGDLVGFRDQLVKAIEPARVRQESVFSARKSIAAAAGEWSAKCPEMAQLMCLSAAVLSDGRGVHAFIKHLKRIVEQHALMDTIRARRRV